MLVFQVYPNKVCGSYSPGQAYLPLASWNKLVAGIFTLTQEELPEQTALEKPQPQARLLSRKLFRRWLTVLQTQ